MSAGNGWLHVVVIGGGQAGAYAVRSLRRRGFEGGITLVCAEPEGAYQRPPLSKEYLATGSTQDVFLLDEGWLATNNVEQITGVPATAIDQMTTAVHLADGRTLPADAVLVATGSRARTLPASTVDARSDRIHTLRTLADARAIRKQLIPGTSLLLVGGGFIGAELASFARDAGLEVRMLERDDVPMRRAAGDQIGAVCAGIIRAGGVDLITGVDVHRLAGITDGVRAETSAGVIEADLAVVGIGSIPNDEIAHASGLEVDLVGGIVVDEYARTNRPGVYAAGDVTSQPDPVTGGRRRIEHADNASRQAAVAVDNLLAELEPERFGSRARPHTDVPWFWSDQFGANLQLAGCVPQPDEQGRVVVRGDLAATDWSVFFLVDGRLRAAFARDRAEDVMVARELIAAGVTVDADRLAEPGSDLLELMDAVFEEGQ